MPPLQALLRILARVPCMSLAKPNRACVQLIRLETKR